MRFYSFLGYIAFVSFPPQQAFNATAVVRHMRRLQLGTSSEGPNATVPSPCRTHLLEDGGTGVIFLVIVTYLVLLMTNSTDSMSSLSPRSLLWGRVLPGRRRRSWPSVQLHLPLPPDQQGVIPVPAPLTCLINPSDFPILTPSVEPEAPSPPLSG